MFNRITLFITVRIKIDFSSEIERVGNENVSENQYETSNIPCINDTWLFEYDVIKKLQ